MKKENAKEKIMNYVMAKLLFNGFLTNYSKNKFMAKKKIYCYLCGKEIKEVFEARVVESPKDVECPPKAPFCEQCYYGLIENN